MCKAPGLYGLDLQERYLPSGAAAESWSRTTAEPELNPRETDSNPHGVGPSARLVARQQLTSGR
jgi:hypothetical protein